MRTICLLLFFPLALLARQSATAESKAVKPPNILFIMIDDLGWRDLGCQGNKNLRTPNVDRFAAQGMRFSDAYAAAPVCSPTRAAVMTGLSPARLQITNHLPEQSRFTPEDSALLPAQTKDRLDLQYTTIAERLTSDAGYSAAFIGKWHLYPRDQHQFGPTHQGFDINIGGCSLGGPPTFFDPYRIDFLENRREGEYLPDRLADETMDFIVAQSQSEKPFFVALFPYTVHWPMEAPAELVDKYKSLPLEGYRDHRYAAMIEAMDSAVGRVLAKLDELGVSDNTFVIFTSDNGPYGGVGDARPLRANKGHLYEGGIRVPLIVRWPNKIEGGVNSEPVILTDLYPTLLEVAGLEPYAEYPGDGQSLLPLLTENASRGSDALYWHYPNFAFHGDNRLGSAIRMGDYKLIEFFDDNSVELYNLRQDIGETTNLANVEPARATEMRNRLHRWRESNGAKLPRPR